MFCVGHVGQGGGAYQQKEKCVYRPLGLMRGARGFAEESEF